MPARIWLAVGSLGTRRGSPFGLYRTHTFVCDLDRTDCRLYNALNAVVATMPLAAADRCLAGPIRCLPDALDHLASRCSCRMLSASTRLDGFRPSAANSGSSVASASSTCSGFNPESINKSKSETSRLFRTVFNLLTLSLLLI